MLLSERLGPDWLRVTIGDQQLPLDAVGPITIRHGRTRVDQQPAASTMTTTIAAGALTTLPRIGQHVTVELGPDAVAALGMTPEQQAAAQTRFVGDVSDLVDSPGAGDLTAGGFLALTAVGRRARLGRVDVGDVAWPAELDGARAGRILAAAPAAGLTVGDVDAGAFTVTARDASPDKALTLLEQLAVDVDALLVQRRDGTVEWHDRDHRKNTATLAITISAADVLRGVAWQQSVVGLVNDVTIAYGDGDPQATVAQSDAVSIDTFGPLSAGVVSTQIDDVDDATTHARDLVARRSRPVWRIEQLDVEPLRTLDDAQTVELLALEVSDLIGVTGFPESGPHVATRLFVEGWSEMISRNAWRSSLAVSDYGLSGSSPRWVDVSPAVRWVDVDDDLTWLGSAGWNLALDLERWIDVPADRRWVDVDPAFVWTTYTNG